MIRWKDYPIIGFAKIEDSKSSSLIYTSIERGLYMKLSEPKRTGETPFEEVLANRRSVREYSESLLQLDEISQLLWSAYGISNAKGLRTAPSAREFYPLNIYLAAERVSSLMPGLYRYNSPKHSMDLVNEGHWIDKIFETTFNQTAVQQSAAVFLFTGDYTKPLSEFGEVGKRYVDMDLGHSAQNLHLQATALNLGTVEIAAFRPGELKNLLSIPENEEPLYLMPIGKPL
jgi:SagB-type dehydrogenase family enzyme